MIFSSLFKKKKRESIEILPGESGKEYRYVSKLGKDKDEKGDMLHVIGDKYPLRGKPTAEALSFLGPTKALLQKLLMSRLPGLIMHEIPYNSLSAPVRAFYDVLEDLINAEKLSAHKQEWRNARKFLCYFLETDFPYRFKFQWLMERLFRRINDIKLDEGDKYHFRAKNFRVDLDEDWKELVRKFPKLKDAEVSTEFKKVLYDTKYSDTSHGNYVEPEILAKQFLEKYEKPD